MKKNFLKVAALLIAAMLLVVSCAQEVKAPENNGLVEAKLSVGYGRDIKVDGDSPVNGLTVMYKMTPKWIDDANDSDTITNPAAGWKNLADDGKLGWCTPGYWLVEVKASKDSKDVFKGSITCYFTKNTQTATVYLSPVTVDGAKGSISIEVSMQDIKESESSTKSYKLAYEVLYGTESKVSKTDLPPKTPEKGAAEDYITKYSALVSNLDSGYYTVIVYVLNEDGTTVGGIRKGFLITAGDNVKLTGHIEPADYANVTINAIYADVNITLAKGASSVENGKYSVTITASDATTFKSPVSEDDFSVTYIWYVDGVQIAQENTLPASKKFDFDAPGYKNIACKAVYTSKTNTHVFFAETESHYVLVNPTATTAGN